MSTINSKLRRGEGRYFHWCPACDEAHQLPDTWTFNGNLEAPSFSPSFKHEGKKIEVVDHKWTGNWVRGADGKPIDNVCHYILTDGILNFCGDCTHELAGKAVPLIDWPENAE